MSGLTQAQLARLEQAAREGDAARYYQLLAEYGFGYGIVASGVVQQQDLSGYIASYFFENKLREHGIAVTPKLRSDLMRELMMADLAYRKSDPVVTVQRIGEYHQQVYEKLGIPADAWAPTFLHDRGADALWCLTCTEAELGGQSPLEALDEVVGDAVDDLTGERFDLGSGPSEGAAAGVAEMIDDLIFDGVLPRALADDLSDRIFGRPPSASGDPSRNLLRESSLHLPARPRVNSSSSGGEHLIQMSIAPGETRTAKVELPGLTLEIEVTMPR